MKFPQSSSSIRGKLTRIVMLTSSVGLLLASIAIGIHDWVQYRASEARDLEVMAEALSQAYPDANPLDFSIPALFRRILSLPGFDDDPDVATEEILEKVQMLWYEEVSE